MPQSKFERLLRSFKFAPTNDVAHESGPYLFFGRDYTGAVDELGMGWIAKKIDKGDLTVLRHEGFKRILACRPIFRRSQSSKVA